MAMNFLERHDLLQETEPAVFLSPATLERVDLKLLEAITLVHHLGVLHLDISPVSILIGPDSNPVLINFGAARDAV